MNWFVQFELVMSKHFYYSLILLFLITFIPLADSNVFFNYFSYSIIFIRNDMAREILYQPWERIVKSSLWISNFMSTISDLNEYWSEIMNRNATTYINCLHVDPPNFFHTTHFITCSSVWKFRRNKKNIYILYKNIYINIYIYLAK